jgi:hypothetical protein
MPALIWIILFLGVFLTLSLAMSGDARIDPMILVWSPVLALLVLLVIYKYRGETALLNRLARGGVVVLPLLLLALVPIAVVFVLVGSDVRLWQGLLAGLVVVLGWLSTFLFQEERVEQERLAKQNDLLLALRAEILNYMWKFNEVDFDKNLKDLRALRTNRKKVPLGFIPSQSELVVFRTVLGNLTVVDDTALHWAVQFYTQADDIAVLASDLRAPGFAAANTRRFQIDLLIKYVEMQRQAIRLGKVAVDAIEEIVPKSRIDAIEGHYQKVKGRLNASSQEEAV